MLLNPQELLRDTMRLYRKEFWMYVGYATWLVVPTAVFYFAVILPSSAIKTPLIILTVLAQLFISLWMAVAIMRATRALHTGEALEPQTISRQALRRIQPVLSTALLQALIVGGGFLLLVVPAFIFWVWYALAQVIAGVEDKTALESLASSRDLVRGRFWTVAWRLVAGPLVIALLYAFLLGGVLLLIGSILGLDVNLLFSDNPPLWSQLIELIAEIFVIPVFVIYAVLLYETLKTHPLEKTEIVA